MLRDILAWYELHEAWQAEMLATSKHKTGNAVMVGPISEVKWPSASKASTTPRRQYHHHAALQGENFSIDNSPMLRDQDNEKAAARAEEERIGL